MARISARPVPYTQIAQSLQPELIQLLGLKLRENPEMVTPNVAIAVCPITSDRHSFNGTTAASDASAWLAARRYKKIRCFSGQFGLIAIGMPRRTRNKRNKEEAK